MLDEQVMGLNWINLQTEQHANLLNMLIKLNLRIAGNKFVAGDIFYNISSNTMFVYDGSRFLRLVASGAV